MSTLDRSPSCNHRRERFAQMGLRKSENTTGDQENPRGQGEVVQGVIESMPGDPGELFGDPKRITSDARLIARVISAGGAVSRDKADRMVQLALALAEECAGKRMPREFAACASIVQSAQRLILQAETADNQFGSGGQHVHLHAHLHQETENRKESVARLQESLKKWSEADGADSDV